MFLAYSAYDGAADKEAVEAWLRRTLERLCRPALETTIRREET